jgi:hypothetical protein
MEKGGTPSLALSRFLGRRVRFKTHITFLKELHRIEGLLDIGNLVAEAAGSSLIVGFHELVFSVLLSKRVMEWVSHVDVMKP